MFFASPPDIDSTILCWKCGQVAITSARSGYVFGAMVLVPPSLSLTRQSGLWRFVCVMSGAMNTAYGSTLSPPRLAQSKFLFGNPACTVAPMLKPVRVKLSPVNAPMAERTDVCVNWNSVKCLQCAGCRQLLMNMPSATTTSPNSQAADLP